MGQKLSSLNHTQNSSYQSIITVEQKIIYNLKCWSKSKNLTILFDSDVDGNGRNTLTQVLLNKRKFYIILIDKFKNVFGGYVNSVAQELFTKDDKAFVFSLFKNGEINMNKHHIDKTKEKNAFCLFNQDCICTFGFGFGGYCDIGVYPVGSKDAFCQKCCYIYDENEFLVDSVIPKFFTIMRILVVEAN